jgi:hypothetical protein
MPAILLGQVTQFRRCRTDAMNVGEPPGGSSAYLLAQDTLCGEFDQERVYGIAWQSKEFSGGFVDFLLGRGGRHPR